ncbi:hypothetical protein [Pendulispora albinea]|uniref:Uncharacterized protein n=1 Tax=Pendulispora albinea TaxID=2741071 RepID=A0ABZ2LXP1_9BACT
MHCVIKLWNNDKNEAGVHSHAGLVAASMKRGGDDLSRSAVRDVAAGLPPSAKGVQTLGPKRCAAAFVFAFT